MSVAQAIHNLNGGDRVTSGGGELSFGQIGNSLNNSNIKAMGQMTRQSLLRSNDKEQFSSPDVE